MDKFNCILYGESGAGKTPFSGTLAAYEKTAPCLLLDVDMGAMSLNTVDPKPVVVPVETWSEVEKLYPLLAEKEWVKLAKALSEMSDAEVPILEYKSLVIDSGTELEYMLRRSIVSLDDRQEGIPDQPHYLKTQERFRSAYRKLRNLPMSLVMTAGIRELKEESTGIVKRYPDFQPSLCHDLIRMTDLVLFIDSSTEGVGKDMKWEHLLIASLSRRFIARDRSQRLEPVMKSEKFFWKDILDKVLS